MLFNVYNITPQVKYTYGCALIAAHSEQEAIETFCKDEYHKMIYEDYNCTCDIIPNMDYNSSNPCTIFNKIGG